MREALEQAADEFGRGMPHILQQGRKSFALVEEYAAVACRRCQRNRVRQPLLGAGMLAQGTLGQRLQHIDGNQAAFAFFVGRSLVELLE